MMNVTTLNCDEKLNYPKGDAFNNSPEILKLTHLLLFHAPHLPSLCMFVYFIITLATINYAVHVGERNTQY